MRKLLVPVVLILGLALHAVPAVAAAPPAASLASAKDDSKGNEKSKEKRSDKAKKKAKPGKAKGGNPPAHSQGKGRAQAPGQLKKAATGAGAASGSSNANHRSENENKKVTFCHVPPGNPANGHLITTSVNAITPGHTNHSGDIIPPFSFVKHGKTVTFPGQNWGPDAQAILDAGCRTPATGGSTVVEPEPSEEASAVQPEVKGASVSAAATRADADRGIVDRVLPDAGGARLALLVLAVSLLVGGGLLLRRRAGA